MLYLLFLSVRCIACFHTVFHITQVGGQGGLERTAPDLNKDSVEENAKNAAEEGGLEGGAASEGGQPELPADPPVGVLYALPSLMSCAKLHAVLCVEGT